MVSTFLMVLFLENVEKYGKAVVFLGGMGSYGQIRVQRVKLDLC